MRNARKLLIACISSLWFVAVCSAQTPGTAPTDFDPFNYTGTSLDGQNGGTGWNGGWFTTSGAQPNTLSTDSTSLSYPVGWQAPLSPPPTSGARVSTGSPSANASTSRLMANTLSLAVDGNVLYVSALIRKNAANGGGVNNDNILLEFVDSIGNRRFGLGIVGNTDLPWLNANGSTSPSGPAVTAGATYFMVAKIVSSATGSDQAFLKVFGTGYNTEVPFAEPTTWDATLTEVTSAVLDRIRIRIDPGNTTALPGEVDEIRIGQDWQSVAVVPEPAAMGLLLAIGLGLRTRRRHRRI